MEAVPAAVSRFGSASAYVHAVAGKLGFRRNMGTSGAGIKRAAGRTNPRVAVSGRRVNTPAMPLKRTKPAAKRKRKRPISAAEARQWAIRHVVRQMFGGARVADGKHARMAVYDLHTEDVWVVFKNSRELAALRTSEVVVVCKRTGRILYEGPANDEG